MMNREWRPSGPSRVWLRLLRLAFPRAFRDRFGQDYRAFLARQRAEMRYAGWVGALRFWADVTLDAFRGGWSSRVGARQRSTSRRGRPAVVVWLDDFRQDIRYGVRTLIRSPMYTSIAVITLGLGIGANSAMFTVVNGVLLRPLPYPDSDRLALAFVATTTQTNSAMSYLDFRDYVEQNRTFIGFGGWHEDRGTFTGDGEPTEYDGVFVTSDVLPLLEVSPILGRVIAPSEDMIGGPRVVVLSHRLWMSRYGGDSSVVGAIATIDKRAHEIVGVMPPRFAFPNALPDYWAPMRQDELLREAGIENPDRDLSFITGIGRLRPGTTIEQATREMSDLALRVQAAENPDDNLIGMTLVPMREWLVGSTRGTLLTLLGAVAFVLAIACVNVGNLTVTRTVARRRELALRTALGAGRVRVVRQIVTEGLVVSMAGAMLGGAIALGLTEWLVRGQELTLPRHGDVRVDGIALVFTAVLAILTGLGFGLLATWQLLRGELAQPLRDAGVRSGVSRGVRRLHNGMVVSQIALALTLLVGAGLLVDSFRRLSDVDPGFPVDNLLMLRVGVDEDRYNSDERIGLFYAGLTERIQSVPGVDAVSTSYSPAFSQNEFRQTIVLEGQPDDPDARQWAGTVIVGQDYFETSGVPILGGRGFDETDVAGGPPVAVINQTMAERYWPNVDPIGKRFRVDGGISGSIASLEGRFFTPDWITVVGVSGDIRRGGLSNPPDSEFHRPHTQMRWAGMSYLIRTVGDPLSLVSVIEREVWQVDPNVPISDVRTMTDVLSDQVAAPRWRTVLLTCFAVLATVLAAVGIYGVTTYGVTQRVREIGIRIALGAEGAKVRREVLIAGVRVALIGVLLGLAGATLVARLLQSLLFEVAALEPLVYVGAGVTMVGVAALACYLPARRASTVDPLTALRDT